MALTSFKHVGIKEFETQKIFTTDQSPVPIGIKTPIAFGRAGEGLFEMNTNIADQIQDNLRNLLLTNHGERLGRYDFGADLLPLTTEYVSNESFVPEAMLRINTAVAKYLPFVELNGFSSTPVFDENRFLAKISLVVQYSVTNLGIFEKQTEITLFFS